MKKLLIVPVLLVFGLTLAACGDREDIGDKTEIRFWHMSPTGSESYSEMRQIIRDFNESQDEYHVRGTGFNFWDYWDRIGVAIASGDAPNIAFHTLDNVVLRAQGGALANISELIAADIAKGEDTLDLEVYLENQLEFATHDDDLYALPFSGTTRMLFYNLDIFEANGLTEDDVPTTWSELETVARQLDDVDADGRINILGFDPTFGEGTYHGFLWQKGLDFFDEDLNPTLDTDEHLEVLEWMLDFNDIYSRSRLDAFGEESQMLGISPFAAGRLGMVISSDGLYQTMRSYGADINYGVAPIPVPDEDGIRVNWGSGFSIEIYDDDPEKVEGTWEFLKYLQDYDTQIRLAETLGFLMSNIPAMEEYAEGNPILEAFVEELHYAVDKVYVPYAPNWHAMDWMQYFEEGLAGRKSAAEVLEAARDNYIQKRENYERMQ